VEDQHVLGLFAHDEWWSFYISVPCRSSTDHFSTHRLVGRSTEITSMKIKDELLDRLLEPDEENPAVRYFAQHDLLGKPDQDQELIQAKAQIMSSGLVPAILENQYVGKR